VTAAALRAVLGITAHAEHGLRRAGRPQSVRIALKGENLARGIIGSADESLAPVGTVHCGAVTGTAIKGTTRAERPVLARAVAARQIGARVTPVGEAPSGGLSASEAAPAPKTENAASNGRIAPNTESVRRGLHDLTQRVTSRARTASSHVHRVDHGRAHPDATPTAPGGAAQVIVPGRGRAARSVAEWAAGPAANPVAELAVALAAGPAVDQVGNQAGNRVRVGRIALAGQVGADRAEVDAESYGCGNRFAHRRT
jgi:hypothetical protein